MRRVACWLAAWVLLVGCSLAAGAQEQIVNGGFETTDTNGIAVPWVYGTNGIGLTVSPVHSGFLAMQFSLDNAPATLTQSGINAPWGHEYLIGFWLYNDPSGGTPGTRTFKVTFDGTELNLGSSPPENVWTHYSFLAYGTGNANASIVFEGQHQDGAFILDDVSVFKTGNIIPEPGLIQLPVLLGLAGLGYWRRRRAA